MITTAVRTWWSRNVSGGDADFAPSRAGFGAGKGAAAGAGAGTLLGAGLGAANKLQDEPYVAWVTRPVQKLELGPSPSEVFGPDTDRLLELVRSRSSGTDSASKSFLYLAHLQDRSPMTVERLATLYSAIEDNFDKDAHVRATMSLMDAFIEKYPGSDPNLALREFLNHAQYETDFDRARLSFMTAHKLSEEDLQERLITMEHRHTTMLGRYSLAQATLMGAAAGLVAGAAVGAGVGLLVHVIRS